MRFYSKPSPKGGETRTKSGFLFFPKTIGLETRWLENATWKDRYISYVTLEEYGPVESFGWDAESWVSP